MWAGSTAGTGLGLAIAKHILARHRAEMTVESRPGAGRRVPCDISERIVHRLSHCFHMVNTELAGLPSSNCHVPVVGLRGSRVPVRTVAGNAEHTRPALCLLTPPKTGRGTRETHQSRHRGGRGSRSCRRPRFRRRHHRRRRHVPRAGLCGLGRRLQGEDRHRAQLPGHRLGRWRDPDHQPHRRFRCLRRAGAARPARHGASCSSSRP